MNDDDDDDFSGSYHDSNPDFDFDHDDDFDFDFDFDHDDDFDFDFDFDHDDDFDFDFDGALEDGSDRFLQVPASYSCCQLKRDSQDVSLPGWEGLAKVVRFAHLAMTADSAASWWLAPCSPSLVL